MPQRFFFLSALVALLVSAQQRNPCSDVLFLIDHSESLTQAQFSIVKNLVKDIISGANFGPTSPDFAALGFGSSATSYYTFNDSRAVNETVALTDQNVIHNFGSTNLLSALNMAMTSVWPGSLATHPASYKRLQILFLDGFPSTNQHACPRPSGGSINTPNPLSAPIAAVNYFKANNIHTVVVGTGTFNSYTYEVDCFLSTNTSGFPQLTLTQSINSLLEAVLPTLRSVCADLQFLTEAPTSAPTTPDPTSIPTTNPSQRPSLVPTTAFPTIAPTPTSALGDPHFTTLDALRYTFNGLGDFCFLRTLDNRATIHVRTHPVGKSAAAFSAVGFRFDKYKVLAVWNGTNSDRITVIAGERLMGTDVPEFETPELRATRVWQPEYESGQLILEHKESGFRLRLNYNGRTSFTVDVPEMYRTHTEGLVGNFDGSPLNDLRRPDGVEIPSNSSMRDIYHEFGLSWRVPASESLLAPLNALYPSHVVDPDPTFEPVFNPTFANEKFRREAEKICAGDAACLYDAAATSDLTYAAYTRFDVRSAGSYRVVDAGKVDL